VDRLTADVIWDEQRAELKLHGDLDIEGADVLHALVTEFERVARIDLSDVDTIDSSGLFAIVQADTRARLSGMRLTLVPPRESVRQIFEWTGLDARLNFAVAA
jgi:anti-sigma B factor antagonist